MAGVLSAIGGLVGGAANAQTQPSGPTPEQALLNQYNQDQQMLVALSRTANTGTEMSTMTTRSAAGANLVGALGNAQASDINAANALAANTPLQNLLQGNQRFTQGAQDFSNQGGNNTFNSPSNTGATA